jgi:hypothetical protein
MIYLLVGIPLLFLGTFTRVYDVTADTCFWVDGLSRSANCFNKGSVVPLPVQMGAADRRFCPDPVGYPAVPRGTPSQGTPAAHVRRGAPRKGWS